MKWKGWIGGVLLVMMLFGTLGCGKRRGSVTGGMVDGCPACRAENEGSFCTGCGLAKPLTCEACGWQPKPGASAPAYCPECGNRLK